jgi:3-oxoacyl-[acyl-carrier-protein] synthase III
MHPATPVGLVGVAGYVPPARRSSSEVEQQVAVMSPQVNVPAGVIELMTGIRFRHVAAEGVNASDLAAEAARRVLQKTGVPPADIDLLIYASVSQDLLEPATANIVQEKLGTSCPVFDLKNACNSFLNAVQVAEALIQNGTCETVLVTVGEMPSRCIKWSVKDREDFKLSFLGYTLGDAGAAALLRPGARRVAFITVPFRRQADTGSGASSREEGRCIREATSGATSKATEQGSG